MCIMIYLHFMASEFHQNVIYIYCLFSCLCVSGVEFVPTGTQAAFCSVSNLTGGGDMYRYPVPI